MRWRQCIGEIAIFQRSIGGRVQHRHPAAWRSFYARLPRGAALREPTARAGNDKPVLPDPVTVNVAGEGRNEEIRFPCACSKANSSRATGSKSARRMGNWFSRRSKTLVRNES